MSFQSWADAPSTGAYTSHEVVEVFKQAIPKILFLPFATKRNVVSGDTLTVPIAGTLAQPTSSALDENLSIPLDKLTITAKTIALTERGRGTMVSQKAMSRSPIDLLSIHKEAIAKQMAFDMDIVLAAAFKLGKLKYVATGPASYNLAVNGTAATGATNNPNFYHIRKMRDLAFQTYTMPPRGSGLYTFIGTTTALRGIKDDPEFIEINKGGGQSNFAGNAIGTLSGVEFVENQNGSALDDAMGSSNDVGEGIFIADEAVYYAVLDQPTIHYDATHDHGRYVSVAWYGDWGAGTSTDVATAGFVRLIHFTSST
jgi:N4-gp56 family major capsid protein